MDVRDLELIRAVYEEGTLSRACIRLNVSQPTLSKKLARLEQVLGAELFHRYPKGLVPTDVARYVLTKAEPLRAQVAAISRHVELMTQLETGRLRLGVGPIIEQIVLPDVLRAFVESTGDVELSIVTENEQVLLSMFAASEVDVVVGPFSAREHGADDTIAIPMIRDLVVAVARPEHPVFQLAEIALEDVMNYSWVAPKAQGTVQQAADHPILSKMKILTDNYDTLKKLTKSSDVICAGPRAVFQTEIDSGQLRELELPLELYWESALLVKPETYATPLARHLVSLFEAATGLQDDAP